MGLRTIFEPPRIARAEAGRAHPDLRTLKNALVPGRQHSGDVILDIMFGYWALVIEQVIQTYPGCPRALAHMRFRSATIFMIQDGRFFNSDSRLSSSWQISSLICLHTVSHSEAGGPRK